MGHAVGEMDGGKDHRDNPDCRYRSMCPLDGGLHVPVSFVSGQLVATLCNQQMPRESSSPPWLTGPAAQYIET
jgi:hypothetical protein